MKAVEEDRMVQYWGGCYCGGPEGCGGHKHDAPDSEFVPTWKPKTTPDITALAASIADGVRELAEENRRLRAIVARAGDVEGMAKVLFDQMNPGINYAPATDRTRRMWEDQARAVSAYIKEG